MPSDEYAIRFAFVDLPAAIHIKPFQLIALHSISNKALPPEDVIHVVPSYETAITPLFDESAPHANTKFSVKTVFCPFFDIIDVPILGRTLLLDTE